MGSYWNSPATMLRAALRSLRAREPARVVLAVPVGPPESIEALEEEADEVVCLLTPKAFFGVGQWYVEFPQLSDEEVRRLLGAPWATSDREVRR